MRPQAHAGGMPSEQYELVIGKTVKSDLKKYNPKGVARFFLRLNGFFSALDVKSCCTALRLALTLSHVLFDIFENKMTN